MGRLGDLVIKQSTLGLGSGQDPKVLEIELWFSFCAQWEVCLGILSLSFSLSPNK